MYHVLGSLTWRPQIVDALYMKAKCQTEVRTDPFEYRTKAQVSRTATQDRMSGLASPKGPYAIQVRV